jgi:hypothetical protein
MNDNEPPKHASRLEPEDLQMVPQCFDAAWQQFEFNFAADQVDAARSRLADLILALAADKQLAPADLVTAAIRLPREEQVL